MDNRFGPQGLLFQLLGERYTELAAALAGYVSTRESTPGGFDEETLRNLREEASREVVEKCKAIQNIASDIATVHIEDAYR